MRALNKVLASFARKNEVEASPVFPVPSAEDQSRNTVRSPSPSSLLLASALS
jgi:hypothetical protein